MKYIQFEDASRGGRSHETVVIPVDKIRMVRIADYKTEIYVHDRETCFLFLNESAGRAAAHLRRILDPEILDVTSGESMRSEESISGS